MKVQIIYSSLSGCTRKVAEGIYHSLTGVDKSIHNLKDGEPVLDGDILLLGYWVDKGGPNEQMHAFLEKLKGRTVGIFCTLAFYADSEHGYQSLKKGVDLAAQQNTVIGSYVCNGALSEQMLAHFRTGKDAGHHAASPEKELRWKMMNTHPTQAEISLAAERFGERIQLYREFTENGLKFVSSQ